MFRIGILSPAKQPSAKVFEAFREGLRALGYIEGGNITIEYRLAAGDNSQLPVLAGELDRLPVDIIVTDGGERVAEIAHEAAPTTPIVMAVAANPIVTGLVTSFAHPGGSLTGFSLLGTELSAKRVELLKDLLPTMSRFAALWVPSFGTAGLHATEEAAHSLGVQLSAFEIPSAAEIPTGFGAAIAAGAEALVVVPAAMFWNERTQIVGLAAKHRLPGIYPEREYTDDGGLISYGPDKIDPNRRAAGYVDRILSGEKPADLPVQAPTKYELVINLKTAKALGLEVPPTLLARADEVIE